MIEEDFKQRTAILHNYIVIFYSMRKMGLLRRNFILFFGFINYRFILAINKIIID